MQNLFDNIFIGDMKDIMSQEIENTINTIIYLGQVIPIKTCYQKNPMCVHIPTKDGKNGPEKIKKIIYVIGALNLNGDKLLIACRAGMSRSVIISTAIYAIKQKIPFDKAYKYIEKIYPQSLPESHFYEETKKVVEELSKCSI